MMTLAVEGAIGAPKTLVILLTSTLAAQEDRVVAH